MSVRVTVGWEVKSSPSSMVSVPVGGVLSTCKERLTSVLLPPAPWARARSRCSPSGYSLVSQDHSKGFSPSTTGSPSIYITSPMVLGLMLVTRTATSPLIASPSPGISMVNLGSWARSSCQVSSRIRGIR